MNGLQNAGMLTVAESIPLLTAFIQGLLSFFSPCVVPLLPVYLSYLAGGNLSVDEQGRMTMSRAKTMVNTVFFMLGISFALMLLGMTFTAAGQFLREWRTALNLVCGTLVILFGLVQLGVIGKHSVLQRDLRLPVKLDKLRMNPLTALVMGFCFSFSWTPCIGPTLSGILMTAAAAATRGRGILLMTGYILGFILPFLATGLFAGGVLTFFRKHRNAVRWTAVVSGVLLIVMGVLIMTGAMGSFSNMISSAAAEEELFPAPDFTLTDQYGNEHTLSEYKGKVVILNFWATWCHWCIKEMPDFEKYHQENGREEGNTVILGIASPELESGSMKNEAAIASWLEENGFTYPVVMDPTGELFEAYQVEAFPTSWFIRADGNIAGYVQGYMQEETLLDCIRQTWEMTPDLMPAGEHKTDEE